MTLILVILIVLLLLGWGGGHYADWGGGNYGGHGDLLWIVIAVVLIFLALRLLGII